MNDMPSASGVRIAGDDYQRLHALKACLEALHDNLTAATNPIIEIGIEEAGIGNGDDVVRYRRQTPHTFTQAKYAVDASKLVDLDYLTADKLLKKLIATHKAITADGAPVEIRLATNRAPSPDDTLVKDRDGRDKRLVPRALQGGPKSNRGVARTNWATVADTDEPTLLAFLNDFYLDTAIDVPDLRQQISWLMTANGLRSDDDAINAAANWVTQQVIAGHRRLTITDIKNAVENLNLAAGSPWATVSIATIKRDAFAAEATVAIDWVDQIDGSTHVERVAPKPPSTWQDLQHDVEQLPQHLTGHTRVLLGGHMRQATAFLAGNTLRAVTGYELAIRQRDQLWTGQEPTHPVQLDVTETEDPTGEERDHAYVINIAANGTAAVTKWLTRDGPLVRKVVSIAPATGISPAAVSTPAAANSLAVAIRDHIRNDTPEDGAIHLFLIGPLGIAALLGHHWNRIGTTHIYEHHGGARYEHAFTVTT